jgi:exonuclease SbcD
MARLRDRFPHTLQLTFEPEGGVPRDLRSYTQRVRGLSDYEIATGFVEHVRDRAVDDWERTLLREAAEHAAREATG